MAPKNSLVKVGIVGAGMISQLAYIANFAQITDYEVVALAELRKELGRLAAKRFHIPKVYSTHHELFKEADVDAVVVVTRR